MLRTLAILACVSWQLSAASLMPRVASVRAASPGDSSMTSAESGPCCCCAERASCQCGCETPAESPPRLPIELVICPCGDDAPFLFVARSSPPSVLLVTLPPCADSFHGSDIGAPGHDSHLVSVHGPPPDQFLVSITTLLI